MTLNSTQLGIVERMERSQFAFSYDSLQQLTFELKLRNDIIESAKALNSSGVSFASFDESRCNEEYWHLTGYGGFQLRDGVKPADAILDIFRSGSKYAFECSSAMVIVYYRALIHTLGHQTFNRLFPDILLYDWRHDKNLELLTQTTAQTVVLPGDVLYFDNPDFNPETPEWRGENAVYLGNGAYYGHGIGITGAQDIIDSLNGERGPDATRSAYLTDQIVRPDFAYLAQFSNDPIPRTAHVRQAGNKPIIVQIGSSYYEF